MSDACCVGLFAFFLFAGIHQLGSGSEQCIGHSRGNDLGAAGRPVAVCQAVGAADSVEVFAQVDDLQAALAKRAARRL